MTAGEVWYRLVAWLRRPTLERQLADELHEHVERLERDLRAEGMSAADAQAVARRQLGNVTRVREESRDAWGFPTLDAIVHDVRYAVRGLVRVPAFTATIVATLALGLGANAAMFAVIDRLMFRPYPFMRDPARVSRVYLQTTLRGRVNTRPTMPYTRYLDLARSSRSFAQIAPVSEWRFAVGTGDNARVRRVDGVGAQFFDFFDAPPALGRYFTPAEDAIPDGTRVAVLAYGVWQTDFGGQDVIGRELLVGPQRYTIVGVAPRGFVGASNGRHPDVFIPITTVPANISPSSATDYFRAYNWDWMEMIVRRKPGVSIDAANAELTEAFIRSRDAQRVTTPTVLPVALARPRVITGALRAAAAPDAGLESRVLLWVGGVAVIVLLVACANVANLMIARVLRRRREIALRLALGVSRGRLVAQFLIEGAALAILGGAAGLAVAQWGGATARTLLLPPDASFNLAVDWRTIAATVACALVAALLIALAPALLATRSDLADALKAGARAGTHARSRLRVALLVAQGALSVALLVGAGLFVRSLRNVLAIPLGYDATSVVEVIPDFRGYHLDSAATIAMRRRLLAVAQSLPGVESATRTNSALFGTNTANLEVPGVDSVARLGRFNVQVTTPEYFRVMRTRILRGRPLERSDREGTPLVAVVSQAMGRALWPGKDPIGQCMHVGWTMLGGPSVAPCTTVVGIAEDAAMQSVTDDQRFMYYLAADQLGLSWAATILVRLAPHADDVAALDGVRRGMQAAMPGQGFVIVRWLSEDVDRERRSWRLGATMFVAFGVLALVVAAVGLYGTIAYDVAQRRHELGVRIAMGAQRADILRLVARKALAFAGAGIGTGIVIAAVAAPWLQPMLYGESARDPATYALVALCMATVALAASAVPAMRAAKMDPNVALRVD